jgi:hypothetical protein
LSFTNPGSGRPGSAEVSPASADVSCGAAAANITEFADSLVSGDVIVGEYHPG